mmetsp:Transcript_36764/g.103727  ORF Transcript_36764/g.103727 Transcript_36764/m.103727 type:complete len:580 (-) Transcript_36764:236-1975(-)
MSRIDEAFLGDVADGLLREYLHKLGCKRTLQTFDEERPRHANSISSRSVLRKTLGLDRLALRLKKSRPDVSLPPTLEMWVENQLEKVQEHGESSPMEKKKAEPKTKGWDVDTHAEESVPEMAVPRRSARTAARAPAVHAPGPGSNGYPSDPPTIGNPKAGFGASEEDGVLLDRLGRSGARGPRSMVQQGHAPKHDDGMMMMEDVEDLDADLGSSPFPAPLTSSRRLAAGFSGTNLSPDQVRDLKELLWAGARGPPPSWQQGFFFNKTPGLEFGLVQMEGGPCGVLAAVQAHVMVAAYEGGRFDMAPSPAKHPKLLCKALTSILWQAGGNRKAVVVGSGEPSTAHLSYEALGRCALAQTCRTVEKLEEAIQSTLPQYMEEDGFGIVLFLFSLALTRSIPELRGDMDVAENSLMGAHGYCTQELVNLIICGRAVSNVFDGEKQLDGETLLRGVTKRCQVGLLTLFEWYKYVEVGNLLKSPSYPVWVVCSESHFTCLFATSPAAMESCPPFDLVFYDGLANQDAPIRLSITQSLTGGHTAKAGETIGDRGKSEGDLVPPLEYVVETRWPGVSVNWNGSDPIL